MTVSLSFHGRQRGTQLSRFSSLLACVQPCGTLWEIVMKPTTTGNRLVTLHTCRTVALLSYKVGIRDHPSFLGPESDSFAADILYWNLLFCTFSFHVHNTLFYFRCIIWCLGKASKPGNTLLNMQSAPMLISGSTPYPSLCTICYSAQIR